MATNENKSIDAADKPVSAAGDSSTTPKSPQSSGKRLRLGSGKIAPEENRKLCLAVVERILPEASEQGLIRELQSTEGANSDHVAKIQAIIKPLTPGMVGRFESLSNNVATGCVLLLVAGTPLYLELRMALCQGVSPHHVSDFQRYGLRLFRILAEQTGVGEPWETIGKISANSDKQWLKSALQELAKNKEWIGSASIRAILLYLVNHELFTERDLRIHLAMPIPTRTFASEIAAVSKRFEGIPPDKSEDLAQMLVEQIPAVGSAVVENIDRFLIQDNFLASMSEDQQSKVRNSLDRLGGAPPMSSQEPGFKAETGLPIQVIQEVLREMPNEQRENLLGEFRVSPSDEPDWDNWRQKACEMLEQAEHHERLIWVKSVADFLDYVDTADVLRILTIKFAQALDTLPNPPFSYRRAG